MLTTVLVNWGQKPWNTLKLRHFSMRIRTKHEKSWRQDFKSPKMQFSGQKIRLEWFKNKEHQVFRLKPRDVDRRLLACEQSLQWPKRKGIHYRVVKCDENGLVTTIQGERNHGNCPAMLLHRRLNQVFTLQRFWSIPRGSRAVLLIMTCWNEMKPSLRTELEIDWCNWVYLSPKSIRNTSKDTTKWFYSLTTLSHNSPSLSKPT